ncbi:MAG: HAMP domain-containing histidine kinase [Lachnospiraceae bacterium]|nr:HAMP domain-containing histidine kinase [Lachnospiraceae bacterium]
MKKLLKILLLIGNLAAVMVLAAGLTVSSKSGYDKLIWQDVFLGNSYLESAQFQQQASESIYGALEMIARSTRIENTGVYDPDKIICVQDYLESKRIYDSVKENEKMDDLCYRFGDLYEWSLKGAQVRDGVLWETYKPLYYGSVQEYCNECDRPYNAVVKQIIEVMESVGKEVAEYQELKKAWTSEATNVRYALWDWGDGSVHTNVPDFQREAVNREELETYFKGFGSYYIFDSRSSAAVQKHTGDVHSYDTYALLHQSSAQLAGEYQIFTAIDTSFPITDRMALGAKGYEDVKEMLSSWVIPMLVSAAVVVMTVLFLFWRLARYIRKFLIIVYTNTNMVLKVGICFVGYELGQAVLRLLPVDELVSILILSGYKVAVLGFLVWEGLQRQHLLEGVKAMMAGGEETGVCVEGLTQGNRQMAEAVNELGKNLRDAMQEQMKSERMKADLITNVSHDLKTPLTSIINYVDLLKKEQIENPKAKEYLTVLEQKSQRLKQLTEDLVEASRASSGNVTLDIQKIDLKELLMQTSGEFEERFVARGLTFVPHYPDYPLYIEADGRRLWRIIENLYRNVEKYAMSGTRVYLDVECDGHRAMFSMKNISEQSLNISPEELMERFTRGDESRTTEGSGLGLAIARDLTQLQGGTFDIYLDGDLFKVVVAFPWAAGEELA